MREQAGHVYVAHVLKQSPALCGGLHDGDEILEVSALPVRTPRAVSGLIAGAAARPLPMQISRAGTIFNLALTPAVRPTDGELARLDLIGAPLHALYTLSAVRGKAPTQAELVGHVVLVEHGASWCAPCAASAPILQALAAKFPPTSLVVLGATREAGASAALAYAQQGVSKSTVGLGAAPFSILRDETGDVSGGASVSLLPTFVLYGPDGTARWVHAGGGPDLAAMLNAQVEHAIATPKLPVLPAVLPNRDACGQPLPPGVTSSIRPAGQE